MSNNEHSATVLPKFNLAPPLPAQWLNGNTNFESGINLSGGVIIEAQKVPYLQELPGFESTTAKLSRQRLDVFAANTITLAIVRYHLRFSVESGTGKTYHEREEYNELVANGLKPRGNLQMAAYLKESDQAAIISFNGTASQEINQQIRQFEEKWLPLTTKNVDGQLITSPLHAFWLQLSTTPHRDVGADKKSEATNPTLNLPTEPSIEWMRNAYVKQALKNIEKAAPRFDSWVAQRLS